MDEDRLGGKTKRTIHIYFPFGGLSETTAELADSLVFFKHDKFIISDSDAKLRMPRSILYNRNLHPSFVYFRTFAQKQTWPCRDKARFEIIWQHNFVCQKLASRARKKETYESASSDALLCKLFSIIITAQSEVVSSNDQFYQLMLAPFFHEAMMLLFFLWSQTNFKSHTARKCKSNL